MRVKIKGVWSEVGSQTGTKLDNNPVCLICTDAIKELLLNETSIEKTINECRDLTRFLTVRNVASPGAHKSGLYLGKVIRWYMAKNTIGSIHYISSGNRVPDSEGGKPIMDLPDEFPTDINYQWYIERTIAMLYDIAYLEKPKQQNLF